MTNFTGHRQPFLPTDLLKCQEKNIKWHIEKDITWFGFDFSGRFYTFHFDDGKIFPDSNEPPLEAPADFDWNSIFSRIKVYHFDKQKEQLQSSYVNLLSRDYSKVKTSCYDPVNMRWFEVVKSSKNKQEKTLKVYSGCIRRLLGTDSTSIFTNDTGEDNTITLVYPRHLRITFDFEFVKSMSGNFLIIMSCYANEGKFIMDLVKYDDEKISHLRRISFLFAHNEGMDFRNMRFDLESNMFYVFQKGNDPWNVSAFDFSTGNELFTVGMDKEITKNISYISIISGSLFFNISCDGMVNLLRIKSNGAKVCKSFQLSKIPHVDMVMNSYQVLKRFDKHFLCVSSRSMWKECSYQVFDMETEKLVYKYSTKSSVIYWEFNWNLQEFACVTNKRVFKVFSTGLKSVSLKENARLACLKSFSKDQLNANLPSSLVKYLDA